MPFRFSSRSLHNLRTLVEPLQRVLHRALALGVIDFAIIEGHRGQRRQDEAFAAGRSKVRWPNGKHNKFPSLAADLQPYVPGRDVYDEKKGLKYWYVLAGAVKAAAAIEGVSIRWGGDWDGDTDLDDQTFNDLGHFEVKEEA